MECGTWQASCILGQDIQLKKILFLLAALATAILCLKHGMKQVSKKRE